MCEGRTHCQAVRAKLEVARQAMVRPYVAQRAEGRLSYGHPVEDVRLIRAVTLQSRTEVVECVDVLQLLLAGGEEGVERMGWAVVGMQGWRGVGWGRGVGRRVGLAYSGNNRRWK